MLSWDEEVTPTASLPPASSRSDELMAARFSGQNAMPAVAPSSGPRSPSVFRATAPSSATATNTLQHVNAADNRIFKRNFGIDLINQLKLEYPQLWTAEFKEEFEALFESAVNLEYCYAEDTMPRGVCGINTSMFKGDLRFTTHRCAAQFGLEALYLNEENSFQWMSEMIDSKKERNFFETRVIKYHSGCALSWE